MLESDADARRHVLHVDMDAFYAAIEQRDEPTLRGRPVIVGGEVRGVVAAASYESRRYGIRSAMPVVEARRRCPELVCIRPRMAHYQAVSREIFRIFRQFTPLVEGLSLDEAFLDVTASTRLFGPARAIAASIKRQIRERTGLTASVGIAANKLVAKIASDLEKPDGLVEIDETSLRARLDPLAVSVLPGIGQRTLARLREAKVLTLADLRLAEPSVLEPVFGRYAGRMRQRAAGVDDRPVVAVRAEKSISAERTFDTDLTTPREMESALLSLSERATARLRKAGLMAGVVRLKIRKSDFSTFTRQRGLCPPTSGTDAVFATARDLLGEWLAENAGARIRLLGIGGTLLVAADQHGLFGPGASTGVDLAVDAIRERFGSGSVGRARTWPKPRTR